MFSHYIGIDLGTANTVIVTVKKGIILDEPSVVAFHESKGKKSFLAVGDDAKLMLGKTPESIVASQPLSDGVIADFDHAETMIKEFFKKAIPRSKYLKPKVVVCVPFGATPVEKRAIQQAIKAAGASSAGLLEEPMAAALGANLPVLEPKGSMVVDIGGGTTEIAVVALGGIVEATSIKTGGNHFDAAVIQSIKKNLNLNIGGYCNLMSGNLLELGAMSPCWGAPQQGLPIVVFHGVTNQPWRRANGQTEGYGG